MKLKQCVEYVIIWKLRFSFLLLFFELFFFICHKQVNTEEVETLENFSNTDLYIQINISQKVGFFVKLCNLVYVHDQLTAICKLLEPEI